MIIELPRNQEIREGAVLTLACSAMGLPPPEIVWYHNNTETTGKRFQPTRPRDAPDLVCKDILRLFRGAFLVSYEIGFFRLF